MAQSSFRRESNGDELVVVDAGLVNVAGERAPGSASGADYVATRQEWNYSVFNPRAAAIGSAKGTIGSVGTTEVLIGTGAPVLLGGVIFEDDSVAGDLLLRDTNVLGANVTHISLPSWPSTATQPNNDQPHLDLIFATGLAVCGTATGVCCVIKWRPLPSELVLA